MLSYSLRLSWNGADVMHAQTTMVCGVDTLASFIRESFAGRDHKAYCEAYLSTSRMIEALQRGESVVAAYSDDTGIAAGEILIIA